jgi:hypothetical protein
VDSLAIRSPRPERAAAGCALRPGGHGLYLRANPISEVRQPRPAQLRAISAAASSAIPATRRRRPAVGCQIIAKYGCSDSSEYRLAESVPPGARINPELPLAHNLYTYFEIEEHGRACEAMLRLLRMVETRAAVPDLYAGLVIACRFCGLLEASLAADQRARRIDPGVRTSVAYTHWMMGDYEQAVLTDMEDIQALRHGALWMLGRQEEARAGVRRLETHWPRRRPVVPPGPADGLRG